MDLYLEDRKRLLALPAGGFSGCPPPDYQQNNQNSASSPSGRDDGRHHNSSGSGSPYPVSQIPLNFSSKAFKSL